MMELNKALAVQILEDEYGIMVDDLPANGIHDLISLLSAVLGISDRS